MYQKRYTGREGYGINFQVACIWLDPTDLRKIYRTMICYALNVSNNKIVIFF